MDITLSDNWLREFLQTKARPEKIAECLSLCSQSVEKIEKSGDNFLYLVEATGNRPDCFSVYGLARELAAILPGFGYPAKLKEVPIKRWPTVKKSLPLKIEIRQKNLCPRFSALIFENVKIKPSPPVAQERLSDVGTRALNNVIDISNYLMLELGQPMHTFDYDKIANSRMILRESKEGEEIITLDGQKRKLPAGAIIIEDGGGRIIDLCGIMGGKNSEVDEKTKRVLLFVQTYNPLKIRKTCQALSFRTEAASRFEKEVDPGGVVQAMERAVVLFEEWCGANVASKFFDIYPIPPKTKTVSVAQKKINQIIGVELKTRVSQKILNSLGFKTKLKGETLAAVVPHWRNADVEISEDLIEEVARIHGYFKLPSILPPLSDINFQKAPAFEWEEKIKDALKYWGFTEVSSYSLVGKDLVINPENHLKISNPLTEDLLYLRTSLIPSLLSVIGKNQSEKEIRIFEMANIFCPQKGSELPDEIMTLTLAITGKNKFLIIKGILESLLKELGVWKFDIEPDTYQNFTKYAKIFIEGVGIGIIGEVAKAQTSRFTVKESVFILDIELRKLLEFATKSKKYIPLPKYPPIIEDLSFVFPTRIKIGQVIDCVQAIDPLIKKVELLDSFNQTRTLKVTYQHSEKNLSDKDIVKVREKIISSIEKKFNVLLKKKE